MYKKEKLPSEQLVRQSQNTRTYNVIPYRLHNNTAMKSSIKAANVVSAFKRAPTIFNILCNDKTKRGEGFRTGIYKVPLINLEDNQFEVYIGATAGNLKDRISEHKNNVRKGELCTALALRAYEKSVDIFWKDAKIIKNILDPKDLPISEKLHILKYNQTGKVINSRQADGVSEAWRYTIRKNV